MSKAKPNINKNVNKKLGHVALLRLPVSNKKVWNIKLYELNAIEFLSSVC